MTIQTINLNDALDLSARFLKVSCPISSIGNSKGLKDVAAEVEVSKGATVGKAVKAGKWLYDPDKIAPVTKAANALRTKHRELTSVWNDSSWRLLPTGKWFDYGSAMNPLIAQFDQAVAELAAQFDMLIIDAEERLGTLFNRDDYPNDATEFRAKFRAEVLQEPLPKIEDCKQVSLPMAELEAMQRNMQRAYADNVQRVQAENFSRLYDVAKALRDSLDKFARGEQKTVHATMLETIEKACSYCTEFNLSGDVRLTALVEDMRNSLTQYTMEEVRNDPVKRVEVAAAASSAMSKAAARKAAMANMSGYMQ
jgi:hypothetical protein